MRVAKIILGIIILSIITGTGAIYWKQNLGQEQVRENEESASLENVLPGGNEADNNSQTRLDIKSLFSPTPIEESMIYEVMPGDSLYSIAKKFGTTIDLIKISNELEGTNIKVGQRLKIIKGEFRIVVDVSQNTLSLFLNGKLVKTYPVGTARYRNTPIGEFEIINKIVNPTWYAPDGVYPYGDPKNILGTRWMGINEPGYGIHGTTQPETIGKYVSRGCIRMYNHDVEELFKIVPVGTKVKIKDKREVKK